MNPQARKEHLSVRSLPHETLVYDLQTHKAHCLNPLVTFIWQRCDGTNSRDDLAKVVERHWRISECEAVVQLALEQLSRRGLLQAPAAPLSAPERVARRRALKKLVLAAAAIPAIMTVTAPSAQALVSGAGLVGNACTQDADCPGVSLGNNCIRGRCVSGKCAASNHPNGTTCGSCGANVCQACQCQNGVCVAVPAHEGQGCGDGFVCQNGNCVPVTG